jgi:thioredoxin-like negative regulator of GroEL
MRLIDSRMFRAFAASALVALSLTSQFAAAQDSSESEIDALVDGSSTASSALQLARQQTEAGDLTGAVATLERALLRDQNAHEVRLNYVALLCQIDDQQGAEVELAKLAGLPIDDGAWANVQSACGSVARPSL